MNLAHIDNPAVSGTAASRVSRLARLVRLGVMACLLAAGGAEALAHQQERGRRDDSAQMRERYQMQAQAQDARFEQRAQEMREEQRRAIEAQRESMGSERRGGRMTPDERRDLRRQIRESGADVYPNAQRR
ncbi:hypothetical protein [Massilia sp.]|uniref:hypothetical protein n=1 Tax=Massilia sp. TaxID=1882437 RepID=UPI00289DCC8B|nr:hypothetical protein [Massilia sp.]